MSLAHVEECHGVFGATLYDPEECQALLARVRGLDAWQPAEVTVEKSAGTFEDLQDPSTRAASILDYQRGAGIYEDFEARVHRHITPLIREVWGVDLKDLAGTQLIRYQPGGHYTVHQDGGGCFANRYFTVLCYLNADFEGGQTSFPTLNHSAQPAAGKVVLFPAQFFHCAEPVTRGEKFVLITWACGPVPIPWI